MEEKRDIGGDDFDPTIRIGLDGGGTENTSTRRIESAAAPVSSGGFLNHITGIFRRRGNTLEAVEMEIKAPHVSLEPPDPAAFPPLEEAYMRNEELGAGGQARLYRGFDLHLRRQAAIKSLRTELGRNPVSRDKFIAEAMITAQLDHPAIVPVYSIHRDHGDNLHLAMKLINGRPFQKYLADTVRRYEKNGFSAREEQRSLDYRLEVFLSVCDALEYAHNRNIMHCDLKPENIMIGEYHEAYLMDWGLARRIDDPEYDPESWKSPEVITGTPRFLSPEALRGEHCDLRSDIYAMGLILYEVATLQPAYSAGDHRALVSSIRRGEMRPVTHRFGYPIPVDLRKIILRAAAWDREKRYRSMEEFSADVRRFIRGEEVSANPDSCFGRLARLGYRHRRMMMSLSLGLLSLGAVAVSFSLYDRIAAEKLEARRTEFRHNRERMLNRILGGAIGIGRALDRQIANLEHNLYSMTTEALFLLNADISIAGGDGKATEEALPGRPETLVHSPGFGYEIDLDNMSYHVAPGAAPADVGERIRRLKMLKPRLLRAIVESRPDSTLSDSNLKELRRRVVESGSPLASIYLGFADGLFALYPGEATVPAGYDHRRRFWYTERFDGSREGDSPLWSSPYLATNGDPVISCTMPMIDTRGQAHGVSGLDASLRQLVASLRQAGSRGDSLLEKSLVDSDGNVVADISDQFFENARKNYTIVNKQLRLLRYPDRELLELIKSRRNGFLIRRENGRVVAIVFAGLYSVPWYYIEKLDLEKLLGGQGISPPSGTGFGD